VQSYTIKIQQFEGPFDLLLFFIERDELDINDIPVAKITEDFLQYIKQLEELNIDVASEFILVAATLMRIKAKLLLPRKEVDELGNEIDPREELTRRLIDVELESLTMFRLLKTFQRLLDQYENRGSKTIHTIVKYNYTINEQRAFIQSTVAKTGRTSFEQVFLPLENRIHAIVTFLSLLELLNLQLVKLTQGQGANNFWLEVGDSSEEE